MFFFPKSSEILMSTPFTWIGWSFPQIWWRSTAASTPHRKATVGAGPWPCCVARRCSGCSWMWSQWVAASAPWPASWAKGYSLLKWLGTIDISVGQHSMMEHGLASYWLLNWLHCSSKLVVWSAVFLCQRKQWNKTMMKWWDCPNGFKTTGKKSWLKQVNIEGLINIQSL